MRYKIIPILIVCLFTQVSMSKKVSAEETYQLQLSEKQEITQISQSIAPEAYLKDISMQVSKPYLKTDKNQMTAVGMSALWPGAGQFYGNNIVMGAVFSVLGVAFIILDNFVPGIGLVGYPGMNIASAILAGFNTPSEIPLEQPL